MEMDSNSFSSVEENMVSTNISDLTKPRVKVNLQQMLSIREMSSLGGKIRPHRFLGCFVLDANMRLRKDK